MDPLSPDLLRNTLLAFRVSDGIYLGIIVICLVISAFFAAAETALAQCNRFKISAHAEAGKQRAKYVLKNLDKFDNSTINILININLFHVIATMLATTLLIIWMGSNYQDLASVISTVVMTIIIFLFSEMLPKYVANKNPDRVAENTAFILYVVGIILTPFSLLFRGIVFIIKKIFRIKDDYDEITEDDFQDTVEDIQEEGRLEEEESEIIQAAVEFGDFTVMDVITPIKKMVIYNAEKSSKRDVIKFLCDVQYTRIPVYEGTPNNIIGILHVKKYLLVAKDRKQYFNFKSILAKPLFVNQKTKIDDMLEIFQTSHTHIAIVKDNKNEKVLGMVTMEDVVEKLVGDIDEKNPPKAEIGGDE